MDDGCLGAEALPRRRSGPAYDARRRRRAGRRPRARPEELRPRQRLQGGHQGRRPLPPTTAPSRSATAGPRWARACTPWPSRSRSRSSAIDPDRDPGASSTPPASSALGQTTGSRGTLMGAGAVADACAAARGRRLPARASTTRASTGSTGRNTLGERRRAPGHPLHLRLRRAARGHRPRDRRHRARSSPSTTSAGPSTRCCARARSRARCTWASATRSPRTSRPTRATGLPTNMTLRSLGILRAKDVPPDRGGPGRVAPAQRALRHQGRGRDRPRADRAGRGRRAPRPSTAIWRAAAAHAAVPGRRAPTSERGPTPGLVCGHHHLYSALARGMPAPPQHARRLPRDPRAGLVAARRRPRPRDAALVGPARRRSRRCSAAPPAIVDHHESPERHRGLLTVIADACAEVGVRVVVRLRRDRPLTTTARCGATAWPPPAMTDARPPRPGRERALPARRRAGHGRRPRRLHVQRRHARRGRRAWPPTSASASTSTWPRATIDRDAGDRLAPLARRRLAARALRPPRPRPARHHRPQPPLQHEQRRGLRPPGRRPNPVVLGTDGIGADMLEEFRLAYVRLRERRRAGHARHAVVLAGGGLDARSPRPRDDR